jgi:hypothetical protein
MTSRATGRRSEAHMPLLLLELLLQIALATHAVRTGRGQRWLWIILVAPGIGCALYVAMEIIPDFLHGAAGRQAARDVADIVAPEREYKRLLAQAELAPTVENRSRLAEECLRVKRPLEARELYESCATGLHAQDTKLLMGLARACFACGDYKATVATLDALRAHHPSYQSADGHMLYARALEDQGLTDDALMQYEALTGYFPGEEARCRYALLLQKSGAIDRALAVFQEIVRNVDRRGGAYRNSERPWYETARRMQAAA